MFYALSLLALTLTLIVALGLQRWRPPLRYPWLAMSAGGLLAWGLAFVACLRPPLEWTYQAWGAAAPSLWMGWPTGILFFTVVTVAFAALLSEVRRISESSSQESHWGDWFRIVLLCLTAALASLASNLTAAAILWSLVDLVLVGVVLSRRVSAQVVKELSVTLAAHLPSVFLLNLAALMENGEGLLSEGGNTSRGIILVLFAAGLRLDLVPPHRPLLVLTEWPPSLRLALRVVRIAPPLALLVQASQHREGVLIPWFVGLIAFAMVGALLGWFRHGTLRQGVPYLTQLACAFALLCASLGLEGATLAWGSVGLLGGALLGLASVRPWWALPLLAGGALALSALPFTPTWSTLGLYSPALRGEGLWRLAFLPLQGGVLAGYLRHMVRTTARPSAAPWVWLIYPWGFILPLFALWMLPFWPRSGVPGAGIESPGWVESAFAPLVSGLMTVGAALLFFRRRHSAPWAQRLALWIELSWLYRWMARGMRSVQSAFAGGNAMLEGPAGWLWSLLILIILASLITYWVGGG